MLIIGLGSGRSGTASLAHLLNSQQNAMCFHELNPSCMKFSGTLQPALNTVSEFRAILAGGPSDRFTADLSRSVTLAPYEKLCSMEKVELIGDIAMYYLSYVEELLQFDPDVRFVCLKREKNATVDSWLRKTSIKRWRSKQIADYLYSLISRTPYYKEYNYWQEHDRDDIEVDPIWDKCFPKFVAPDKKKAVEMYWEYYYEEAARLSEKYPKNFKIFNIDELNTKQGQLEVLRHCAVPEEKHVYTKAHLHAIP